MKVVYVKLKKAVCDDPGFGLEKICLSALTGMLGTTSVPATEGSSHGMLRSCHTERTQAEILSRNCIAFRRPWKLQAVSLAIFFIFFGYFWSRVWAAIPREPFIVKTNYHSKENSLQECLSCPIFMFSRYFTHAVIWVILRYKLFVNFTVIFQYYNVNYCL